MNVMGVDHVYLTVSDFPRSEAFYDGVMELLGFRKGTRAIGGEPHAHYFNRAMQISIRPARTESEHDPYAPGLHHLCLQLSDVAEVDAAAERLSDLGVSATEPRLYSEYDPDYYATFFEDPDGLRFELVARRPARDEIAERWDDLRVFENPIAELRRRESGSD